METGFDHRSFEIVRNDLRRHAAQKGKSPDMTADPVWQALGPAGLNIGVVRRPKGRDEDLGSAHFARARADDIDSVSCIIDKQPLARRVPLTHHRRQAPFPTSVELTVSAVAVAIGVNTAILFPQKGQRHTLAAQLSMNIGPIRLRDRPRRRARLMWKEPLLKINIRQIIRQRPAQSRHICAPEILRHRRTAQRQALRDLTP